MLSRTPEITVGAVRLGPPSPASPQEGRAALEPVKELVTAYANRTYHYGRPSCRGREYLMVVIFITSLIIVRAVIYLASKMRERSTLSNMGTRVAN